MDENTEIGNAPSGLVTTTFAGVRGMTCSSCATHVSDAVTGVGARNVAVDWQAGTVQFQHERAVPIDRFSGALEEAGYPATKNDGDASEPATKPKRWWIGGGLLAGGGLAGFMVLCCALGTTAVVGGIAATVGLVLRNPFIIAGALVVIAASLTLRHRGRRQHQSDRP